MSHRIFFKFHTRFLFTGLIFASLALLLATPVLAQPANATGKTEETIPLTRPLRFERLTLENGLSQNSVFTLLQDHQGYLWVGTQDGLNRFDGFNFTIFKHDAENPESLSNNAILALFEDQDGILWIGTWGGGLDSYNPQTGQFSHYQNNPSDSTSLSSNIVTSVLVDRQGRLWVGTCGGGLNMLDRETGAFSHFQHNSRDSSSLISNDISQLFEDASGNLWIGTGCLGNRGAGLDHLILQSQSSQKTFPAQFVHFQSNPNDPNSLSNNNVSSIIQDASGYIWVGTGGYTLKGSGINRIDTQSGMIEQYRHDPGNNQSLSNDDVMDLMLDSSGILWVATWGGGLDLTNPNQQTANKQLIFSHQRNDSYNPQSISSNLVWSMLEDFSGVFWVGTANGGINKINPQAQQFAIYRNNPGNTSSLVYDAVGPILEDSRGRIWISTLGGGLQLFNPQTDAFTHYYEPSSDPASQQANTLMALLEDDSGLLWTGTLAGLGQFDPISGKSTYYRHNDDDPNTIINDNVSSLAEDTAGGLWIGTLSGLDHFSQTDGTFTHLEIPELESVLDLYISSDNILWVGSWGQGLFRLDPDTLSGNHVSYRRYLHEPDDPASLAENDVVDILQSSDGFLWVGTQGGLDKFDPGTGKFNHFQVKDGLPDNSILCLQEDHQGNLWISTNNGLSRLNPGQNSFRNFYVNDGLQSNEFDSGSCAMSSQGDMYFGGQKGLNVFNPDDIRDNLAAPPVVVTAFSIFNKPAAVDLSGKTPIKLSYTDNFFSFDFVALDFHNPQNNQYMYKLDGFDSNWVDAGTRRYASYTNLPGGNYTFKVKASNNNDVWNETGISIPVQITPPLWQNWWFQAASLLALVAIGFLGARWRIESVNTQNRHLEELVELRTSDLKHTNEKLMQAIDLRQKAEAALAQKAADDAVVAERSRLARDLHDAVTQTLFSASLIAEVLPQLWNINQDEARNHLKELRELTRGALAEMRTLLLELRPTALTDTSLPNLLRQLVEAVNGRARLHIELCVDGDQPIPPDVQVALYRIAQESFNNIVKYAKAKQVFVNLKMLNDSVRLAIMDDGVGFNIDSVGPNHLGIRIMRERAEAIYARLNIYSEPGEGTQVSVTWEATNKEIKSPD